MPERSQPWDSTGVGDGALSGYTETQVEEFFRDLFTGDRYASEGVLAGVGSELAVTSGTDLVNVAAGAAMVYGHYYQNTASTAVAITRPTTGTTGLRVNLRADWAAQTVRAVVNRNTNGVSAIPALVQTAGTTWDIPLATGTITTGGSVSLTDAREFCHFPSALVYRRQGGSATDWSSAGTTAYRAGDVIVQVGAHTVSWPSSATSNLSTITFPTPFAGPPIIQLTTYGEGFSNGNKTLFTVETLTASQMQVRGYITDGTSSSTSRKVFWLAIGPAA